MIEVSGEGVEESFSRRVLVVTALSAVLAVLIPLSASIGFYAISPVDFLRLLAGQGLPEDKAVALWLRLRRSLVAVATGALLGGGGAVMQAALRNPLASPFTLGISHAAALGVAVYLLLSSTWGSPASALGAVGVYATPVFAFSFAVAQTALVLLLAQKAKLEPRAIVLSAIAIAFTYQAVLALLQYLVLNELQIATIVFWMFGDLSRPGDAELRVLVVLAPAIAVLYIVLHADLDILSMGDDLALSSGVNPGRLRLFATLLSALGAALATSFVGVLAFLCLVAPHIARILVGSAHRYLIPASMLTGPILLILADIASRTVLSPVTLPVGILLSFIGAPLLVLLLLKGGGYGYS